MRTAAISTLLLVAAATTVNLVSADWQLTSVSPTERQGICDRNKAFCVNNCGSEKNAPKNFCNATTMGWGCGCTTKVPDIPDHLWPIVQAECNGRAANCRTSCSKLEGPQQAPCQTNCTDTFNCNEGKMPPSRLRVDTIDQVPDYEGTGANKTGSGKSGADSQMATFSWVSTFSALTVIAGAMWTL